MSLRKVYATWGACALGIIIVFSFQKFYPGYIGSFSNIITPIIAGAAFLSALSCLRKYGRNPRKKFDRVWIYFSAAMASWMIAEITWGIYYFFLNVPVPYPSVADFFYLGAYLPMGAALGTYYVTFRAGMTVQKKILSSVIVALAALLVIVPVLLTEFAMSRPGTTTLLDVLYPICDLILIALATFSFVLFFGGTLGQWWTALGVGIILDVLGDETFLYQAATNTYYNGSFSDVFYILAYLMFGLAFYIHRREL